MNKWYHVSSVYLGENPILIPKVPETSVIDMEGDIPRICVSDDILKCIRSIISTPVIYCGDIIFEFRKPKTKSSNTKKFIKSYVINPFVYYATSNLAYLPPNASDYRLNNEHWFIYPTEFYFIGNIDMEDLVINNKLSFTKNLYSYITLEKSLEKSIIPIENVNTDEI